jgi:OmpA-OmpF porin, OOP family
MKKLILLACAAFTLNASAQNEQKALLESKSYDNWYIGVNGGVSTKTTHNKWLKNLNPNAGLRVGRWFTPAFGLEIESNTYFDNQPLASNGTVVKYGTVDLGATINLSNWWFGYNGEPRLFEVIAVPAVGMGHIFGKESKVKQNLNDFTGKLALDFAFNVDKKKCVQIYLEPAMLYSIYGNTTASTDFGLDINRSHFQLNVGFIYKFKNTNGTHNFKYADPTYITDDSEVNRLNGRIAELMAENERLKNIKTKEVAPRIIEKTKKIVDPVVTFKQGSSDIEKLQYANIEKVAQYLKKNDNATVKITGYASTEGSKDLNQKLSEARAESVKHALISKYGISAGRIEICGEGATDSQSSEAAYNRIAVMKVTE